MSTRTLAACGFVFVLGALVGRGLLPAPATARAAPQQPPTPPDDPYAEMLHVGVLVPDLDAAVAKWKAMGFRDIQVLEPSKGVDRTFCGKPLDCTLRQAFIRGTKPMIELMQPVEDVPNPWSSVLKEKGEVLHHLAYRIPHTGPELAKYSRLGMKEIAQGKWPEGDSHWGTFHYVKGDDDALILEFISRIPRVEK